MLIWDFTKKVCPLKHMIHALRLVYRRTSLKIVFSWSWWKYGSRMENLLVTNGWRIPRNHQIWCLFTTFCWRYVWTFTRSKLNSSVIFGQTERCWCNDRPVSDWPSTLELGSRDLISLFLTNFLSTCILPIHFERWCWKSSRYIPQYGRLDKRCRLGEWNQPWPLLEYWTTSYTVSSSTVFTCWWQWNHCLWRKRSCTRKKSQIRRCSYPSKLNKNRSQKHIFILTY